MLTLSGLEVLDRVAQCGTRHDRCILIKKAAQLVSIDPLARFSQRPADGLVDQVMRDQATESRRAGRDRPSRLEEGSAGC